MKNGTCLKCGSDDVHHSPNGTRVPLRSGRSSYAEATVHAYVCTRCGYLEQYVSLRGDDPRRVDDIKAHWKKAGKA